MCFFRLLTRLCLLHYWARVSHIFLFNFFYLTLSTLLTVCRKRFALSMKLVLSSFALESLSDRVSECKIRKSGIWFLVGNPNFLFLLILTLILFFTWHFFQHIVKHKLLATGKQLRNAHNQRNKDLHEQFTILKKCRGKFECLLYEMLSLHPGKKPKLNTKSDSIMAKLFSTQLTLYILHCRVFNHMQRDFYTLL